MIEPAVIAAALTAAVALVGILVELRRLRSRIRELEEQNRQTQLLEVLKKRIECYPALWDVVISHTVNWPYTGAPRDWRWAESFLQGLDRWNAGHGVFFSAAANVRFKQLRGALVAISAGLDEGGVVTESSFRNLYYIVAGDPETGERGLTTYLRNDLGSYRVAAIQSSKTRPEE